MKDIIKTLDKLFKMNEDEFDRTVNSMTKVELIHAVNYAYGWIGEGRKMQEKGL